MVGVFVGEFAQLMKRTQEENKVTQNVQALLTRGRAPEEYNRPLVEAISLDGRLVYGLLESPYSSGNYVPVVHETMPESGGVPHREMIVVDSIREVLVPGHRGGCAGDCCREGYSEETSYPECWTWEQVRTGVAERYQAWKDWVL